MAAAIITEGFEVLVHEVIEAIETMPWSISNEAPSGVVTSTLRDGRDLPSPSWAGSWPPLSPSGEPCGVGSLAGNDDARPPSPSWCLTYVGSTSRNARLASATTMRSWGRLGPAMEGTTVDRSSSRYSL